MKGSMCELPHILFNNLTLKMLRNKKLLRKPQNWC